MVSPNELLVCASDAEALALMMGERGRINALEAWMWLDGPDSEEGRVGGAVRELFLTMNATALNAPDPGAETNPAAFPAAYARLADLKLPAQVLWGDADFPHIQQRCVHLVQAIPRALGTVIPGTAHLPNLEQPEAFNRLPADRAARQQFWTDLTREVQAIPEVSAAALADRLRAILQDPALRDRLGAQARAFAGQFTWERSAERTEAHLERVRYGRGDFALDREHVLALHVVQRPHLVFIAAELALLAAGQRYTQAVGDALSKRSGMTGREQQHLRHRCDVTKGPYDNPAGANGAAAAKFLQPR